MTKLQHAALAMLALAALVAPAAAVAADEAAARPQVRVGDTWVYRQTSLITQKSGNFTYRATEVAADRIKTAFAGYSETYTADWNLVESSAGMKITPHEGYFDFPLEPGKTWPFSFERTVAKTRTLWIGTVTVRDWETIEVPAGSFRALRIDVEGSFGNAPPARRSQLQQSYWWSPEVRRWVRLELWMSRPASKTTDFHTRTELVRFTPVQ